LALLVTTASVSAAGPLPSDLDDSRTVEFSDFLIFIESFNTDPASDPAFNTRADLDANGTIDFFDFPILTEDFGNTAPDVGNDVGNGLEIIHGPDSPESSNGEDRDNPFRSLTVHLDDANILLLGTERNGFVRTVDGGQTWTRHRLGLRHIALGYPEIWDIAYDPADPEIVYAATLGLPGARCR